MMPKLKFASATLYELARHGAPARIRELEGELQLIYQHFPDLFPNGLPVVSGPARRKVADRSAAAQRLIEGAEALAGPSVDVEQSTEENDLVLPVSEAAKRVGLSQAGVRNWLAAGKLKAMDKKGPRNTMRVRLGDVRAIWDRSPYNPKTYGSDNGRAS